MTSALPDWLQRAKSHLLQNVVPAAREYSASESALSAAYNADSAPSAWADAASHTKRKASELAVAIDGMVDRVAPDGDERKRIRIELQRLATFNGFERAGCIDRVRAIANAYKHSALSDQSLPIKAEDDVLVIGAGFGTDAYGVGKNGGVEVLVRDKDGLVRKFLGGAPCAISAWFSFLAQHGAQFGGEPIELFNVRVYSP
jgi:hypothetical protein